MKRKSLQFVLALGVCTASLSTRLSSEEMLSAQEHVARGMVAEDAFPGYVSLCDLEARMRNVNVPRDPNVSRKSKSGENRTGAEKRPQRTPIPPTQVFDNLYFLGTHSVAAWLYGTEEGYLLIDGLNTDEEAQKYIFDGMAALGLSKGAIKGILVTHGHGDHYGGADYVAEALDLEVMMSEADWKLTETLGTHPRFGPPPERGISVKDKEVLSFGTSELITFLSPGHTPGTISPMFTVYDQGVPHNVLLWGGTGFNFGPNVPTFFEYAASAKRIRNEAKLRGVDVFISGHPRRDGAVEMLEALGSRSPNEPHPFVKGEKGYVLFEALEHCALAQAVRFSSP